MKYIKLLLILLLSSWLVSCGHNVTASGVAIPKGKGKKIHLVCDRELDSAEVHDAVKNELHQSGYQVVDHQSKPPANVDGVILHYHDVWSWDMVTLIRTLDVKIVDGRSKYTISQAHYLQKATWPYPEVDFVVKTVFDKMRAKGTID